MKLTDVQKAEVRFMVEDFLTRYDQTEAETAYACKLLENVGMVWITANPPELRMEDDDV